MTLQEHFAMLAVNFTVEPMEAELQAAYRSVAPDLAVRASDDQHIGKAFAEALMQSGSPAVRKCGTGGIVHWGTCGAALRSFYAASSGESNPEESDSTVRFISGWDIPDLTLAALGGDMEHCWCGAASDDATRVYVCTRMKDHDGKHVAGNGIVLKAVWS